MPMKQLINGFLRMCNVLTVTVQFVMVCGSTVMCNWILSAASKLIYW